MKGYKAFGKGMICKGKQYAENTVFEEETAEVCKSGMHFCKNPLDCLDYYPLIDDGGNVVEMAEVEALDECKTDDSKKFCTKKLKIGAKIKIANVVDMVGGIMREEVKGTLNGGNDAQQVGGFGAKQVGGNDAKQVGGNDAQQVGGNYAKQVGGNDAQQVGGNYAKQVGGNYAKQVGGFGAKQVGGNDAQQVGGNYAKQVGGNYAKQVGGNYAKQVGGNDAQQVGGNYAKQVGGNDAQQVGGNYAKQVGGNYAKQVGGSDAILINGFGSSFKAGIRSIVVCYEYKNGKLLPPVVAQIDGEKLKPDTWYTLENGEFTEVKYED